MYKPGPYWKSQQSPVPPSPKSVESLQSAHDYSIQQLDELQSQLDEVRVQRSRTPSHLREEIGDKDQEIQRLQNAVFSLQLSLRDQEEALRQKDIRINQQAATIQIHSEEIAKTNRRLPRFDPNPIRLPSQAAPPSRYQGQEQLLPGEQATQLQIEAAPHFKTKWGDIPRVGSAQDLYQMKNRCNDGLETRSISGFDTPRRPGRAGASDAGSPVPLARMSYLNLRSQADSNSHSPLTTPPRGSVPSVGVRDPRSTPVISRGSGEIPIPPIPPHTPDRSDSVVSRPRSVRDGAVMLGGSMSSKQSISTKAFSDLFDHVVEFAYTYANVPSTQADSHLPQELKERLMNAATKTTAHKIVSSQYTRYLLVAKIMIMWLQANVFQENTFAGLDRDVDMAVAATRQKIFNNTPAPVRYVFLRDIATQFTRLRKAADYEDFLATISHRRATELWSIIRPMMYHKIDGDWQNMHDLMTEAHRVAEMQLSETAEFRLFFPKIHDPFNDASMINMDPEFDHLASDEIMSRRASVRLGAIPQVMARITSPEGSIVTKTLIKAGVLLKVGDQKK